MGFEASVSDGLALQLPDSAFITMGMPEARQGLKGLHAYVTGSFFEAKQVVGHVSSHRNRQGP